MRDAPGCRAPVLARIPSVARHGRPYTEAENRWWRHHPFLAAASLEQSRPEYQSKVRSAMAVAPSHIRVKEARHLAWRPDMEDAQCWTR